MENLDSLVFARMKNIHKGEGQQIMALDIYLFTGRNREISINSLKFVYLKI